MSSELEEIRRFLLQVLYDDYGKNRHISSASIALALELDESLITDGLDFLVNSGLVDRENSGFRLSKKGFTVTHQRNTSYCPHL